MDLSQRPWMYSWSHVAPGALFVHVPKCAGGSTHVVLKRKCDFKRLRPGMVTDFDSLFKFAFVRNPWDRMVSAFHYAKETHLFVKEWVGNMATCPSSVSPTSSYTRATLTTFKDFVENQIWIDEDDAPSNEHWRLQVDFTEGLDFVGRIENIDEDMKTICEKLGITDCEVPHIRASEHEHYTKYSASRAG